MQNSDQEITVAQLRERVYAFRAARGWNNSDNAKHLAMALTVEAAELQEIFMWCTSNEALQHGQREIVHLQEEIADVLVYLFSIADQFSIDLCGAVEDKLHKNAVKYPVRNN